MRIAVAGGTGVVGRHVVEAARGRGHEVVVLARSQGVDLSTGAGLDLAGVQAVVDVTSIRATSGRSATRFFTEVTRRLLAAERAAGVGHHLVLSIVGLDDAPYGYYAGKAAQERLVQAGEVPWTLLRATQFHEFAGQVHERMRLGPVALVPAMRSQPIAAREVAARLVALAEAGPAGRVPDLAGPREERMAELSRRWAAATGVRGRVLELPVPGRFGRALRDGTLLARPGSQHGEQTFEQWLTAGRAHPGP
ncbi:SDR family oxidoreductase [Kocuria sp. SM24M-10]|uniref:SDR family oxidoreductase n=1 Tax=Kocuria sp. SM24M-10 TaxID=1660349 RepID=UPI00064B1C14|nr:NAD(P)H-binding protein [Kocuria sp. SM24M-10]KLU08601.1 3-beta hydroxysteroid dehydrogenase [Kocuria sp. SM24M-10]